MALSSFDKNGSAFCMISVSNGGSGYADSNYNAAVGQWCPGGVVKGKGTNFDSGYVVNYGPCIDTS